jgi:UDP-perosamine 4-acetyltransferase
MNATPVVIIGAGGHATVVAEIVQKAGVYRITGYTAPEERPPDRWWPFIYLGDDGVLPVLRRQGVELAVLGVGAVGDNRKRRDLFVKVRALGFCFPSLAHHSAIVAEGSALGEGSVVGPGAVVNTGVEIGANTIINSSAVVEHGCVIGEHVHVAPGAVLCGGVYLGGLAHVGAGAVVIQGVTIGEGAVVGAGAVVLHDVEPWTVVAGNPARTIKPLQKGT